MLAVDQLKLEINEAEEDKTYLFNMVDRNIARINHLISDLLDSTKISELNYEKTTMADLIAEWKWFGTNKYAKYYFES